MNHGYRTSSLLSTDHLHILLPLLHLHDKQVRLPDHSHPPSSLALLCQGGDLTHEDTTHTQTDVVQMEAAATRCASLWYEDVTGEYGVVMDHLGLGPMVG